MSGVAMPKGDVAKLARIGVAIALMVVGVFAARSMVRTGIPVWHSPDTLKVDEDVLSGEADTFRYGSRGASLTASSQEKGGPRTLEKFDSRRAFPGAPPVIPHPLLEDKT